MKPYTLDRFGTMHWTPDWCTARENAGPDPVSRETLQAQLRNSDIALGRRHNESTSSAATRVMYDAIALREALEGLLEKKRGSVKKAKQLLEGLDAQQELSDENFARKQKKGSK